MLLVFFLQTNWFTICDVIKLVHIFLFICVFYLLGCASYLKQADQTKTYLRSHQYDLAINNLKEKAETSGKDQLMYLLDYATILQIKGEYKKSALAFQAADKLIDEKDYHSVSQVVGSALGSEEMIQYKGESYEKFLINSLNAINYLMLGDYDSALVECRRINNKISAFRMEGRDPYEFSSFARYLAAIIWEADRKYDDAYIEYEGAYQLDPKIPFIASDLIRSAYLAQRFDLVKKWKKEFDYRHADSEVNPMKDKNLGEIVVIFQEGFGARKVPRYDSPRFPTLRPEYNESSTAQIEIIENNSVIKTQVIYDIDSVAMRSLEKDYAALIARRVGGIVAKAVVSDQIRQKNNLLGDLAWIAMNVSDRADLRQWSTLPAKIQIARIFLKPGKYKIKVKSLNSSGFETGEPILDMDLLIKSGQKAFVNYRSLR